MQLKNVMTLTRDEVEEALSDFLLKIGYATKSIELIINPSGENGPELDYVEVEVESTQV